MLSTIISKIKLDGAAYDVIPHKLADGSSHLAQIPTLTSSGYAVACPNAFNIPTPPTANGQYLLTLTVSSSSSTVGWGYKANSVIFTDTDSANKIVFIDSGSYKQLVYFAE